MPLPPPRPADALASPVDLPDRFGARRPGLRWAAGSIAVATLFLGATNAVTIRDWAEDLTPSLWQAEASAAADRWVELTDRAGIGTPRAGLHALWKRAQALRFGDASGE